MKNFDIFHGTIIAEKYVHILEQHMLPSRRCLFRGLLCIFQQDNAKQQAHGCQLLSWCKLVEKHSHASFNTWHV
ncbi:hypothetical protein UPYG_G00085870 [Umbra pygmaea]|uniref:Uncharacterized protein n=1 Tax=Umbra pygmaea TaxID=75934 RepID=A0ABD0XTZ9_UMBPY